MIDIQDGDKPLVDGMYVAYVNHLLSRSPFAARKLLMYVDKEWTYLGSDQKYRDTVYGYIGPLPMLELED